MPVHRIPGYPNTRVYTRAGVVVHNGWVFYDPVDLNYSMGGDRETLEFAMATLQNIDWTGQLDIVMPLGVVFGINTPSAMIFFSLWQDHRAIL